MSLTRCTSAGGRRDNEKWLEPVAFGISSKFTLENNGTLPVYIHGFDVGGVPCSNLAFQVTVTQCNIYLCVARLR